MPTSNADRLRRYKAKMQANGFIRLNIWAHPELQELLVRERKGNECYARTIERLLLEKRFARPGDSWTQAVRGGEVEGVGFPPKPSGPNALIRWI